MYKARIIVIWWEVNKRKKIKIHENNSVKYREIANGLSVQRCLHWQGIGKTTKLH